MKCVTRVLWILTWASTLLQCGLSREIGVQNVAEASRRVSIIGSNITCIRKYPYNAAVLSTTGTLLGAGMIYNRRWIVTTAMNAAILPAQLLMVRLGSTNALRGGKSYQVAKVITHPNFTGLDWDWDVGLLKLKRNIRFGRKVKAIKLSQSTPNNGTTAIVTGWGITEFIIYRGGSGSVNNIGERLQYLATDVVDTETCLIKWPVSISQRTYCGHVTNAGPCAGDIGDPLVHNGVAIGMYAGGYYCGDARYPDFYVDLAQYRDWINETIKANSPASEHSNKGVVYYKERT